MKKTDARRGSLVAKLTAGNVLFLLLLYVLESCIAERNWLAVLVTYAPQHLFGLPVLVLVVWSLFRRKWPLLVANLCVAGFFSSCMLGFNIPWRVPRHSGQTVRIITCNIHHTARLAPMVARDIRASGADIVCLQEANYVGGEPNPLIELRKALPGWQHRCHGQLAVFSRLPITGMAIHRPTVEFWRVFLEVTVNAGGKRLTIINVHLNTAAGQESFASHYGSTASYLERSTAARSAQIAELLRVIKGIDGPLAVVGDFNTPPRGLIYATLCETLTDSFHRAGWGLGYSFRADLPVMRIDYVFAGRGVEPVACRTMGDVGSDHRPVLAELALTP